MIASRQRILKTGAVKNGSVLYWMSRDQRVHDNWALFAAYRHALDNKLSFFVVFTFSDPYPSANLRSYDFMIKGLQETEKYLILLDIPFIVLIGHPPALISDFIIKNNISAVYTDFDPILIKKSWKKELLTLTNVAVYEIDAHNIVPCRMVSLKQEFSARTFRQKITPLLSQYLDDFPEIQSFPQKTNHKPVNWEEILQKLAPDTSVWPVEAIQPGYTAGMRMFFDFKNFRLERYATEKNDPTRDVLSKLSPYLHFGQISAQRIVIEILKSEISDENTASFQEELIVRRELSDNFCYYNAHYNNLQGAPSWALKTLEKHRTDVRDFNYNRNEYENALTHDELWNAAQREMVKTGKMHGYMRMYWAKKILEWSDSPEEALETAIFLNDKYSLDGRDPNGYAGCLWAIAGLHDRPWKERSVFGMIRYMNRNGCERKFNVKKYISMY